MRRRCCMATIKDPKATKGICDRIYVELHEMHERLLNLREMTGNSDSEKAVIDRMASHLDDLIETVDWKIQVLSHSCAYDWQGSAEFEDNVQVNEEVKLPDKDFSPGYMGG
jgi:hypothetical protein